MPTERGTPSASGLFVNFLAALVKAAPRDLTDEIMLRWSEDGEGLTRALRTVLIESREEELKSEPAVPPPPALPDLIVLPFGFDAPRIIADGDAVSGPIMLERAKEANATSGKKECEDFLAHANANENGIPAELRGKVTFVFVDWRHPDNPEYVALVYWFGDRWVQDWGWLDYAWLGHDRPVRRSTKLQ